MTRITALLLLSSLFANPATAQLNCSVVPAGESCGPRLEVTFTPLGNGGNYELVMQATGLHPRSAGGFNWGANPASIPLPGGGCLLLCDYVWGHYFQTDAVGAYSYRRSWPNWATIYFYMQMGSMETYPDGSFSVRTTNCVIAGCR